MTTARRLIAFIVIAIAVFGVHPRAVSAHASLLSSSPAADSVVDDPPVDIVLTFTEPVDLTDEAIRVLAADGTPVALGEVTAQPDRNAVTVPVADTLGDGSYIVSWAVVSADSHPIRGTFVFSIGAPSGNVAALLDEVTGDQAGGANDAALGVGRFASFAGSAMYVGVLAGTVLLARERLRSRRVAAILFASSAAAVVGTALMIAGQADAIGSSLADWASVADTQSGKWWVARLAALVIAAVAVPWRRVFELRSMRVVGAASALGVFAIVAAGGHAVSGRAVNLAVATTVVHLAAMAVWLGGLVVIAVVIDRSHTMRAAMTFSPLALGAVVALSVTGAFNGWRQLRTFGNVTGTDYGRWLLVKLVVVALVVAMAAASRYLTRNAASVSTHAGGTSADDGPIRRTVIVESVGLAFVLVATAGLTAATPPKPATEGVKDVVVTATQDSYLATVELFPAVTGGTVLHVTVTPPGGGLQKADEITVTADLPTQELGPIDIVTFPAGANHVTTNEADFPLPGEWTLTVTARFGEFDQVVLTSVVSISSP
jgi:copper transport protein